MLCVVVMKIIKLNVGGTRYQTTYDTLVLEPLSKLALLVHHAETEREETLDVETLEEKMAEEGTETEETKMEDSSNENAQTEDPEEIFIDRNGQLFEFILEVFVTCTVESVA